ncbi:MAG: peptidoglycan DD-metalloendopeptidase family protein [Caldithrix sp.]|nr:peptidoglycan DD-metalloendopeptidase family protein [Caldithrix sp.]
MKKHEKDQSRIIFISKDQRNIKEYKISRVKLVTYISVFLIVFLGLGKLGLDFLVDFGNNAKIKTLERTNAVLEARLIDMKDKINIIDTRLTQIVDQDDELRTVLGLEKLSSEIRNVGIGGSEYDYESVDQISGFESTVNLSEQLTNLSKLERTVKLELSSYQQLLETFQDKQDSIAHFPALRPILKGVISSGYGVRKHPMLGVYRHHDGIDISADRGTPVYATADGLVTSAGNNGGYGKMIQIDHKYGFETGYGHLDKMVVRRGQHVKRGDKIGEVGSTGLSTASHLHYEVLYNGKHLNPKMYYFDDKILNEQVVRN